MVIAILEAGVATLVTLDMVMMMVVVATASAALPEVRSYFPLYLFTARS